MCSWIQPPRSIRKKPEPRRIFTGIETGPTTFEWMMKHQDTCDALQEVVRIAPVLGYPDFSREFILETDASLNCLGTVLSQQGKDG